MRQGHCVRPRIIIFGRRDRDRLRFIPVRHGEPQLLRTQGQVMAGRRRNRDRHGTGRHSRQPRPVVGTGTAFRQRQGSRIQQQTRCPAVGDTDHQLAGHGTVSGIGRMGQCHCFTGRDGICGDHQRHRLRDVPVVRGKGQGVLICRGDGIGIDRQSGTGLARDDHCRRGAASRITGQRHRITDRTALQQAQRRWQGQAGRIVVKDGDGNNWAESILLERGV